MNQSINKSINKVVSRIETKDPRDWKARWLKLNRITGSKEKPRQWTWEVSALCRVWKLDEIWNLNTGDAYYRWCTRGSGFCSWESETDTTDTKANSPSIPQPTKLPTPTRPNLYHTMYLNLGTSIEWSYPLSTSRADRRIPVV
jgi:hypothetical protein